MGRFIGQSCAALLCGFIGGVVGIVPGTILGLIKSDWIPTLGNDFGYIFVAAFFGGIIGYVIGAAIGTTLFLRAAKVKGEGWGTALICITLIWLCFAFRYLLWVENRYIEYLLPIIAIAAPVLSVLGYCLLPRLVALIPKDKDSNR